MAVIACSDGGSGPNDSNTGGNSFIGIWIGTVDSELGTINISTYSWSLNYGEIPIFGYLGGYIDSNSSNNLYTSTGRLFATASLSSKTLNLKLNGIVNGMSGSLKFTPANGNGNAIIISGIPKVGETLTASSTGNSFTGTFYWYSAESVDAGSWSQLYSANGNELVIQENHEGKYIYAERMNSTGTAFMTSIILGPIQSAD